jgi:hypothetical protein
MALQPQVGLETLEGTPERLLRFLLAVSRYPNIRRRLRTRGYGREQHEVGHQLLKDLGEYDETPRVDLSDASVRAALQELNATDEDALTLIGAALRYRLPEHHAFMVEGLASSRDEGEAATTIAAVLDRMGRLEAGNVEEELKAGASVALEAMADKGLDGGWREHFAELCAKLETLPDEEVTVEQLEAREQARVEKLLEIRAFFEEWSETARVEFKGRRELIRLGLAQLRRSDNGEAEVVEPVEPAVEPTAESALVA